MTRFGIAGTGRISEWVLTGAVQDLRFKAVAVCSRQEHTAFAFIQKHPEWFTPDTLAFDSIEAMAACPQVDAIYIGTPNTTHFAYAMAAIRAGKHVLCEKPLACNEAQVSALIQAARAKGVLLMEAMVSTLQPAMLEAVARLDDIGPLRHISASFCQYSSKYDALKRGQMASSVDPEMGGGAIEDIGIYTIYPLVSLFGEPDRIEGAELLRMDTPHGPVDMHGTATLHFPGGDALGFTAQLVWSKICDGFVPTEFCGEGGNILLDGIHIARQASMIPHGTPASGRGQRPHATILYEDCGERDTYYYEWREFIDTLESGRIESELNSHSASLITRRVMDRIRRAAPLGS